LFFAVPANSRSYLFSCKITGIPAKDFLVRSLCNRLWKRSSKEHLMIEVENIAKNFKKVKAVDGIGLGCVDVWS